MKNTLSFIRAHPLQIIIAIATVAAAVITYQRYLLAILESSRAPILIYYPIWLEPSEDENDVAAALRDLENIVFAETMKYVEQNPGVTYSETLDLILPISKTIPASPSGVVVAVRNVGSQTATDVREKLVLSAPIKIFAIYSNEQYEVINGGVGEAGIELNVKRLTVGDSIYIAILFDTPSTDQFAVITASRTSLTYISQEAEPMTIFQKLAATQTAIALLETQGVKSSSSGIENVLGFSIERINDVTLDIFVSSNEIGGVPAKSEQINPEDAAYLYSLYIMDDEKD